MIIWSDSDVIVLCLCYTEAVEAVLSSLEDIRGLVDGPHGDPEFLSEILQNEQLQNLLSVSVEQNILFISFFIQAISVHIKLL